MSPRKASPKKPAVRNIRVILKSSTESTSTTTSTSLPAAPKRVSAVRRGSPRKVAAPRVQLSAAHRESARVRKRVLTDQEEDDEEDDLSQGLGEDGSDSAETSTSTVASAVSMSARRLTARQRAALDAAPDEALSASPLLSAVSDTIPSSTATPTPAAGLPLTEEEQLRKSEVSRRRKHQRDLKLEESKAATIQRLLQKQGSRSKKMLSRVERVEDVGVATGQGVEAVGTESGLGAGATRYVDRREGAFLTVAVGGAGAGEEDKYVRSMLGEQVRVAVPRPVLCAAPRCKNAKKYVHSVLMQPVCSLACYRALSR